MNVLQYKDKLSYKKYGNGKIAIYSALRRKWVACAKEEMCRQCFVYFLHHDKKYPLSLIAEEKKTFVNRIAKRFDLLAYDIYGAPFLLVEIKSPDVELSIDALLQSSSYQAGILAKYMAITNGHNTFVWAYDPSSGKMRIIDDPPDFPTADV